MMNIHEQIIREIVNKQKTRKPNVFKGWTSY